MNTCHLWVVSERGIAGKCADQATAQGASALKMRLATLLTEEMGRPVGQRDLRQDCFVIGSSGPVEVRGDYDVGCAAVPVDSGAEQRRPRAVRGKDGRGGQSERRGSGHRQCCSGRIRSASDQSADYVGAGPAGAGGVV
jgi:hypothetical protein